MQPLAVALPGIACQATSQLCVSLRDTLHPQNTSAHRMHMWALCWLQLVPLQAGLGPCEGGCRVPKRHCCWQL
jgi:hypothetical protein